MVKHQFFLSFSKILNNFIFLIFQVQKCHIYLSESCTEPTVVTIKTNTSTVKESQNLLKIIVSPKLNRTFTICLRPIHFNRSIAFDIVEWVEYYRLMGVEHFVIYNFNSDPLTNRILNYYINKGFLTVVQWQVPYHVIPKNHYYDLV